MGVPREHTSKWEPPTEASVLAEVEDDRTDVNQLITYIHTYIHT